MKRISVLFAILLIGISFSAIAKKVEIIKRKARCKELIL